jgi:hypothetical protein
MDFCENHPNEGLLLHKFIQQVEQFLTKPPKLLKWRLFYNSTFCILVDFCEEDPQLSIRNHMNSNKEKSQFHVMPNAVLTGKLGAQRVICPSAAHCYTLSYTTPLKQA